MFILSLDGGGIRGVLTAQIIKRIVAEFPDFLDRVDLLAGTSTGGLLALAIAFGLDTDEMVGLYRDYGDEIFASRGFLDSITHMDELVRANYDNAGLRSQLERVFGDAKYGEAAKRCFISTFNISTFKPHFMLSDSPIDSGLDVIDVGLRTSAAPTYFPTAGNFIDGGVIANNPADCAIIQALGEGHSSIDIFCLSIGTGHNPVSLKGGDLGFKQWILPDAPLLKVLMDGGLKAANYRATKIIGDGLFRLNPKLPREFPMDDPSVAGELIDIADAVDLTDLFKWLSWSSRDV